MANESTSENSQAVEELLAALAFTARPPKTNEELLAVAVEALQSGRMLPAGVEPADAIEALAAVKAMDRAIDGSKPVPEVLRSVMERTLQSNKKAPSLVVSLSRRGLNLVKSTLAGLELQPQVAVAVRSTSAPVRPRLEMRQVTAGGLDLEYQVMQEADDEMLLVLRFRSMPDGIFRVDLREDERLVDSQTVKRGSNSVSFSRITEGGYQVDITGPVQHSFGLFVAAES